MDKAERGANHTISRLKHFGVDGEIVMDIGANVGYVTRWLKDHGVKKVVAYEPHPLAFAQLKKRCPDCELVNAALLSKSCVVRLATSKKDADADYFCNATIMTSILPVGTEVKALSFSAELRRIKPTAIKMDVEGSEYDLLLNTALPKKVKWISMEVHKLNNPCGPYLFAALVAKMDEQGFGMMPLQPSVRPKPGVCKSYWGFMQVDFARTITSTNADTHWVSSLIRYALRNHNIIKTRVELLQVLFDKEFTK